MRNGQTLEDVGGVLYSVLELALSSFDYLGPLARHGGLNIHIFKPESTTLIGHFTLG